MTPFPRLMLPAFFLVACGADVSNIASDPAPLRPAVSLTSPSPTPALNSRLTFTASVAQTGGFLYVYLVDPAGKVDQLLPNRTEAGSPLAPDLRVEAGQVIAFPPADARFFIVAAAPAGHATLLAFASTQPLNLNSISSYPNSTALFATGKVSGADALSTALKLSADAQPGNLYSEDRLPLTITP